MGIFHTPSHSPIIKIATINMNLQQTIANSKADGHSFTSLVFL